MWVDIDLLVGCVNAWRDEAFGSRLIFCGWRRLLKRIEEKLVVLISCNSERLRHSYNAVCSQFDFYSKSNLKFHDNSACPSKLTFKIGCVCV